MKHYGFKINKEFNKIRGNILFASFSIYLLISVITVILYVSKGYENYGFLYGFLALTFVGAYCVANNKYKKEIYNSNIYEDIFSQDYEYFTYNYQDHLSEFYCADSRLMKSGNFYSGEDKVSFEYKGMNVILSDVAAEVRGSDGKGFERGYMFSYGKNYLLYLLADFLLSKKGKVVDRGVLIKIHLDEPVFHPILVQCKNAELDFFDSKSFKNVEVQKVNMVYSKIRSGYDIWGTNQEITRNYLTPSMLEGLLAGTKRKSIGYKVKTTLSIHDRTMYIYLKGLNLMMLSDVSISKKFNKSEAIDKAEECLEFITGVIDQFADKNKLDKLRRY